MKAEGVQRKSSKKGKKRRLERKRKGQIKSIFRKLETSGFIFKDSKGNWK